jgi:hypothetical protein
MTPSKRGAKGSRGKGSAESAQPARAKGAPAGLESVNASDLRAYAEAAHGQRDKPLVLVRRQGKKKPVLVDVPAGSTDEEILEVNTPSNTIKAKPALRVFLQTPSMSRPKEVSDCDAVFWSESSIDKFMFPYYFLRLMTPEDTVILRDAYLGGSVAPEILGFLHYPPSRPERIIDPLDQLQVVIAGERDVVEVESVRAYLARLNTVV